MYRVYNGDAKGEEEEMVSEAEKRLAENRLVAGVGPYDDFCNFWLEHMVDRR